MPAMDAGQALADLTEVSSQINGAVLFDAEGKVLGSTFSDGSASADIAAAAREALDAAGRLRPEANVVQLQVAALEGSLFVVREGERLVAAVTRPDPTVGLVFYDLKSCLRLAADDEGEAEQEAKPKPRRRRKAADAAS